MQVQVEKRLSSGLTVLFTSTFQDGATRSTYLNSGLDAVGQFIVRDSGMERYIINLNSTYALPFFTKSRGVTRTVLGGWNVAGFGQWRSGAIMDITGATSTGIDPGISGSPYSHRFNTCTFNNNTGQRQNCSSATEAVAWIVQKPFTLQTTPNPQWSSVRSRIPLSVRPLAVEGVQAGTLHGGSAGGCIQRLQHPSLQQPPL